MGDGKPRRGVGYVIAGQCLRCDRLQEEGGATAGVDLDSFVLCTLPVWCN